MKMWRVERRLRPRTVISARPVRTHGGARLRVGALAPAAALALITGVSCGGPRDGSGPTRRVTGSAAPAESCEPAIPADAVYTTFSGVLTKYRFRDPAGGDWLVSSWKLEPSEGVSERAREIAQALFNANPCMDAYDPACLNAMTHVRFEQACSMLAGLIPEDRQAVVHALTLALDASFDGEEGQGMLRTILLSGGLQPEGAAAYFDGLKPAASDCSWSPFHHADAVRSALAYPDAGKAVLAQMATCPCNWIDHHALRALVVLRWIGEGGLVAEADQRRLEACEFEGRDGRTMTGAELVASIPRRDAGDMAFRQWFLGAGSEPRASCACQMDGPGPERPERATGQ